MSILVTLAVLAMIPAWYPSRDGVAAVVAHLLFLQVPFSWESVGLGSNLLWWSLSTIAAFYLLLPLVARRYLRHPLLGLLLAICISVAWQLRFGFGDARWAAELPRFLDDFAIGMTAAAVYVAARRRLSPQKLRRSCTWLVVPTGALLLCLLGVAGGAVARGDATRYEESPLLGLAVAATFAVLFVATAFLPRAVQWPLSNRFSRWLGDISFGVFLYHLLILHVVATLMGLTPPAGQTELNPHANWALIGRLTLIVVPATLAVAWLSTVLVERPFRARFRRWARRFDGQGKSAASIRHPVEAPISAVADIDSLAWADATGLATGRPTRAQTAESKDPWCAVAVSCAQGRSGATPTALVASPSRREVGGERSATARVAWSVSGRGMVKHHRPPRHSRPRNPEARATGRDTAARTISSVPARIRRSRARVTAV